jgi:transcriptional regulator with XRE-family HTH domain
MLIHEAFNQTLKRYRISGRALAQAAEVSESLVSQFRHGKTCVTDEMLDKLLQGIQVIAPGARKYFCSLIAGEPAGVSTVEKVIEAISEDEIPELLMAIARRWKATDNKVLQAI